jgi:hypothetical protein
MDKFGYAVGILFISSLIGLLVSSFFTFVAGLFLDFEFTIWNILKVWGVYICFNILVSSVRGKG